MQILFLLYVLMEIQANLALQLNSYLGLCYILLKFPYKTLLACCPYSGLNLIDVLF